MKTIVLDTSALIRFYIPDGPLPTNLERHIESAWQAETTLLVPELALVETGQVLFKKEQAGYLDSEEADEIMGAILEMPLEIVGHRNIVSEAMTLARKHRITVYDAIFLQMAVSKGAELITADLDLKKVFEKLSQSE